MNIDVRDDIVFIACVANFHERREQAMGLPMPSDLLISLHQYGGLVVGREMLGELDRMSEAQKIQEQLETNRERVNQLHGWVQKMVERQDGWAKSTRRKNVGKVKRWLREAEGLTTESEGLIGRLGELQIEQVHV